MNHHDPVVQDIKAHHARIARDELRREVITHELVHNEGDVIEALREATWGHAQALQELFLAYAKNRDDEALGRAVRRLIDAEIAAEVERQVEGDHV